jgi:hypothetical protein
MKKNPEKHEQSNSNSWSARSGHWFLQGIKSHTHEKHDISSWWNVVCLTGLDYFGSLGYAPGVAALAAGILAPPATLVLCLLTVFGALPMYRRVAVKSPHGQGSISMLEQLVPGWAGKAVVLCLIGFAATDFIITITLSAADAAAHIVENNYVRFWYTHHVGYAFLQNRLGITLALLSILGIVFLLGFRKAISVAVIIVWSYMLLNAGISIVGCTQVFSHPELWSHWLSQTLLAYKTPINIGACSLVLFPQLALGLSGFETGVAVMPLVRGDPTDTEAHPVGRIRNTHKLLAAAAWIMSIFLLISSVITTLLIPAKEFKEGGMANGRALSYIAHNYMGHIYGSCYDVATIFILWFSGASALAGLLSLVPKYLPRYGMAPEWARAMRPLVVFFTIVSFAVTLIFKASVDAQSGAYATGVLVLMTSAAVAVAVTIPKKERIVRLFYFLIAAVFIYTTLMNISERPEGLHIAVFFILTIFVLSFVSRAVRATELRSGHVEFDLGALEILPIFKEKTVHLVAHKPGTHDYAFKEKEARELHHLEGGEVIFLEVSVGDASEFSEPSLHVQGICEGRYHILRCRSAAVPNAIASIVLAIRDRTKTLPNTYMYWTEGNPIFYALKYLFLGEGETAPVTREILREAEPHSAKRPRIHVT